ncbi:MAG: cytochrome-c oxidase, cbb3-type subunit III [Steroidobacteraceae bacterium]
MSSSVSWYIIILTVLNVAGLAWLLLAVRPKPNETVTSETTGHVWDEDLREYNNPLPRWWLWLFIITIVFAIVYLVLYPGMGSFKGTLGWTQQNQHATQAAANEALLQQTLAPFAAQTIPQLEKNPAALTIGRNLFANNCATCHGADARGAPGFPNLVDNDWLWGGDIDDIVTTITDGRIGVMAPWGEALGPKGVEDVLAYVMTLSGRSVPAGNVANGKARFGEMCVACHGADGTGNKALGAPNLTDSIWLHGGSVAAVRQTIEFGRQNEMPAQGDRLGKVRINLLAAYVLSLHGSDAEPGQQAAIDADARE